MAEKYLKAQIAPKKKGTYKSNNSNRRFFAWKKNLFTKILGNKDKQ